MRVDKRKLCIVLSSNLYNRLQADTDCFGVSKSHIVANALMEYYQRRAGIQGEIKGTQ